MTGDLCRTGIRTSCLHFTNPLSSSVSNRDSLDFIECDFTARSRQWAAATLIDAFDPLLVWLVELPPRRVKRHKQNATAPWAPVLLIGKIQSLLTLSAAAMAPGWLCPTTIAIRPRADKGKPHCELQNDDG